MTDSLTVMDGTATSLSIPLLYRDISAVIKRRLLPRGSAMIADVGFYRANWSIKTIRPGYAFGINTSTEC